MINVLYCSHFDLSRIDKVPKELFDPEIQKELLVLEEQEVGLQCITDQNHVLLLFSRYRSFFRRIFVDISKYTFDGINTFVVFHTHYGDIYNAL